MKTKEDSIAFGSPGIEPRWTSSAKESDTEFNAFLDSTIQSIYEASTKKTAGEDSANVS